MAITRLGPNQDITAAKIAGQINFKNLIINGDMSIAQRRTSRTGVGGVTNRAYPTVDRFTTSGNIPGAYTVTQDTDVPTGQGFSKSLKFDCTTADTTTGLKALFIQHKLEGQNLQHLKKGTSNAESVTISFWVKSNLTGDFTVELHDTDNNRHITDLATINSANTWEKKIITFGGDTTGVLDNDNAESIRFTIIPDARSDFTSGTRATTWQSRSLDNIAVGQTLSTASSTDNEFYLTGVQLEVGTSASDFEFLPFDVNLRRCERYYQKSYILGDAPATTGFTGYIEISGFSDSYSHLLFAIPFKTRMRTTPTVTYYNNSGTSGQWSYVRNGASGNGTATSYSGRTAENNLSTYVNIGAAWTGGYVGGQYTVDAEL